ncbi:hypothetical protein DSL72_000461 [Monilinia vaccinii-corymbosi]|uniref:Ketopantoate reductase C-terminal domain-containing protein n=1 Tax=Monilinia vaccinii-corymbosi TaxID=61207 RepID=A0A8A3NZD7_9HELO|nr:hypothetical protein DSL72_000461 [Monilinia vaccinii-corymbosi]
MLPSYKPLWRLGALSRGQKLCMTSIGHVRQPGKLLYQRFQQQSRENSTAKRGKRIYVTGEPHLQAILANSLAQSGNSRQNPVTLLVPSNKYIDHDVDLDGKLCIFHDLIATTVDGNIDMELLPFPMESSPSEQIYPPAENLRFNCLPLDDDPPLPLGSEPVLGREKEAVPLPISNIQVYDLASFLVLNKNWCGPVMGDDIVDDECVAEIQALPQESNPYAATVTHSEPIDTKTIDYLIYGQRPANLVGFFSNIKHRLSPSSVVMVIGDHPGLVDQLCDRVFPKVSSRPSFVECTNGSLVVKPFIVEPEDSLRPVSLRRAQLSVGPLVNDGQTPAQIKKREAKIEYLVERILKAPRLGAVKISRAWWPEMERYRLRRLVARSVTYPLTVAYNCMLGEIFSTEERVQEARLLFEEACAVVQAIDPTMTSEILLATLLWRVVTSPTSHPLMWKCVDSDYHTNNDIDNDWIRNYGRGMTPTHDKYAKIVKEMASQSARDIAAHREELEARLLIAEDLATERLQSPDQGREFIEYFLKAMREGLFEKRRRLKPGVVTQYDDE